MIISKPEKQLCGECGCKDTTESMEEHIFPYGIGKDLVQLTSIIPIHKCRSCGFQWYNWEAEEIMDSAVQQHISEQSKNN